MSTEKIYPEIELETPVDRNRAIAWQTRIKNQEQQEHKSNVEKIDTAKDIIRKKQQEIKNIQNMERIKRSKMRSYNNAAWQVIISDFLKRTGAHFVIAQGVAMLLMVLVNHHVDHNIVKYGQEIGTLKPATLKEQVIESYNPNYISPSEGFVNNADGIFIAKDKNTNFNRMIGTNLVVLGLGLLCSLTQGRKKRAMATAHAMYNIKETNEDTIYFPDLDKKTARLISQMDPYFFDALLNNDLLPRIASPYRRKIANMIVSGHLRANPEDYQSLVNAFTESSIPDQIKEKYGPKTR